MRDKPLIVGVSGRKRHGKDQVATYLEEYGTLRIAFADELKRVAMDLWDLSFDQVYGSEQDKETVDPRWGLSPRVILQRLGTEVGRNIHPLTWVRKVFTMIDAASRGEEILLPDMRHRRFMPCCPNPTAWVIPDARFPNEATAIQARGGLVIKVVRPDFLKRSTDMHASEVEVDNVVEDALIVNDGSLADLRSKVQQVAQGVLSLDLVV